jgi:competence protein ComEA
MSFLKSVLAALLLALTSLSFANDTGVIDINTADAKALEALNGIGPVKAAAIVAYRDANGPFATIEELADVQGIGLRTVELNRANLSVGVPTDETAATTEPASNVE